MATHSSTLAWKIPWTEELGRLQSIASQSRIRLSMQAQGKQIEEEYFVTCQNSRKYSIIHR